MEEDFRDIVGYEGIYQISNYERIINIKKNKLLKTFRCAKVYKAIMLYKNGVGTQFYIHRLVAQAFLGLHINSQLCCLHKKEDLDDQGFLNNCLYNLWIGTLKDNSSDCLKKGRTAKGLTHPKSKKVNQYNLDGEFIKTWDSIRQAEAELGIDSSSISAVCKGKLKTAGRFIWKNTPI